MIDKEEKDLELLREIYKNMYNKHMIVEESEFNEEEFNKLTDTIKQLAKRSGLEFDSALEQFAKSVCKLAYTMSQTVDVDMDFGPYSSDKNELNSIIHTLHAKDENPFPMKKF